MKLDDKGNSILSEAELDLVTGGNDEAGPIGLEYEPDGLTYRAKPEPIFHELPKLWIDKDAD